MSGRVKSAVAEAAAVGVEVGTPQVEVNRIRRNYFFAYVSFKDGTGTMSKGLRNTTEINEFLATLGQAEISDVTVIFGQERKARVQTKVSFR